MTEIVQSCLLRNDGFTLVASLRGKGFDTNAETIL